MMNDYVLRPTTAHLSELNNLTSLFFHSTYRAITKVSSITAPSLITGLTIKFEG